MSDTKSPPNGPDRSVERRSNTVLRSLIDAMLERVREAQRKASAMSPEERKSAEHDLAAIMERVRQEATQPARRPTSTSAKRGGRSGKKKRA
jgi:acyl-CoA reductase-like NAD-dependent aldehyde dehydrogenase